MTFEQIADKYVEAYKDATRADVLHHLNKYPGRVIANDHMVIMFVRIDQETLNKININPRIVANHEFINECYRERGEHIYLLKGFGNTLGYRDLVHRLIRYWSPLSISYHIDKDNFNRARILYESK